MAPFFQQIAQGLAFAQQEAARHITPENINRGLQMAREGVNIATQQINQHVTQENINRGIQLAQEGVKIAQQQIHQHVTPENINHGMQLARDGINIATQQIHQHVTQENINHGLQAVRDGVGIAAQQIHQHVNQENINHGVQLARDGVEIAAQQIKEHVTKENIHLAAAEIKKNLDIVAQNPAVQQVATTVHENKVPIALTAGILTAVAPGIVTAPIMAVARILGFTSRGVAAASIASGAQASMGNIAAGSGFAVLQSAAAGGYGRGVLAGVVRSAGIAATVEGLKEIAQGSEGEADVGDPQSMGILGRFVVWLMGPTTWSLAR